MRLRLQAPPSTCYPSGMHHDLHRWDLTPKEAVQLQRELCRRVRTDLQVGNPRRVAGVDVSYDKESGESFATVVVLSFPQLQVVEEQISSLPTPFPYLPGLLSFREIPAILPAFAKLQGRPDLVFVDGHGQAHPRRMGIATHLGLWLEMPTIGIGKSRLCGEHSVPAAQRGSIAPLLDKGEEIALVLRSRDNVKPIYVSSGYGLPLAECLRWTLQSLTRYRLPEPIRQADRYAALAKKAGFS
ncbi:MAG TPA: deoxyribonuclease V [Acidobacteriota bacterium]|nr:deoxyribonuclease V [Acidobacteriota bacterium]